MNPVTKTILGSIARHWLGAFLAVAGARIGLHEDAARTATAQLTDDMVSNAFIAVAASAVPVVWSILSRLALLLRTRVALLMSRGSSEQELRNVIAEAPKGARLAAVLTADPLKLAPIDEDEAPPEDGPDTTQKFDEDGNPNFGPRRDGR